MTESIQPPALVNGEILISARQELKKVLDSKLSSNNRVLFKTLDLLVMYIQYDHPRTTQMYLWFRPFALGFGIVASALLVGMASGHLSIGITFK